MDNVAGEAAEERMVGVGVGAITENWELSKATRKGIVSGVEGEEEKGGGVAVW